MEEEEDDGDLEGVEVVVVVEVFLLAFSVAEDPPILQGYPMYEV